MISLLFGAFVCLQLSALLLAAPATEQLSSCADRTLTITVDAKIVQLYIDGTLASPANADDWTLASTASVPAWAEVIAVKAEEVTGENSVVIAGILASGSNFVSDGSWKCTNTFYPGWETKDFNDASWKFAAVIGKHGVSPWGKVAGISDDAYWIWTSNNVDGPSSDLVVYCRKHLPTRWFTGGSCTTSCVGQKDGDYQSCTGCDVYASCSNGILYDNRPCAASGLPGPLLWDDGQKRCERISRTCWKCGGNGIPCSGYGTGTRCIISCIHREDGDYQSCYGCNVYASCYNGYLFDNLPCQKNSDGSSLVWDDDLKRCEYTSQSCTTYCP